MAATSSVTDGRPAGITCEKYVRGEGKRCRHYLTNGGCALSDEFMCVEWLKVNGHRRPTASASASAKDLFGNPVSSPPAATSSTATKREAQPRGIVPANPEAPGARSLRGLTTADIETFKALGVEVRLRSEAVGEIWLVPAYTGQPRKEITPEHVATLCRVLDAFPGSHVTAFDRTPAAQGSPA